MVVVVVVVSIVLTPPADRMCYRFYRGWWGYGKDFRRSVKGRTTRPEKVRERLTGRRAGALKHRVIAG